MTIYSFFEKILKNHVTSHRDLITNHPELNQEYGEALLSFVTYPLLRSVFAENNTNSELFHQAYAMDRSMEDLMLESQCFLIEKTDNIMGTWIKYNIGSKLNELISKLNLQEIHSLKDLNAREDLADKTFLEIAAYVKSFLDNMVSSYENPEYAMESFNLVMLATSVIYNGLNTALSKYAVYGEKSLPVYTEKYKENAFSRYVKTIISNHVTDMYRKVSQKTTYTDTDELGNEVTKNGRPLHATYLCSSLDAPVKDSEGKESMCFGDFIPSDLPAPEFTVIDRLNSPDEIKAKFNALSKHDLYQLFSMTQEKRQTFIDNFSIPGNKVSHFHALAEEVNRITGIPGLTDDYLDVSEEDLQYTGTGSLERHVSNRRNYLKRMFSK